MRMGLNEAALRLAAAVAVIAMGTGCHDADTRGGGRLVPAAQAHPRLDPRLGDFVYAIDSLQYVPPKYERDTAYLRVYASTPQPVCAGITVFMQTEGDSAFLQAYGLRPSTEVGCQQTTRSLAMLVWTGGRARRDVIFVAAQPDSSELHIPITITDPLAP